MASSTQPPTPRHGSAGGIRRILVIETAYVGDVVFVEPLVRSLKAGYPRASLSLLVAPRGRGVAETLAGVDRVLVFDKHGSDGGIQGLRRMGKRLRGEEFDLVVTPHTSLRSAILALLSGSPVRAGFARWFSSWSFTHRTRLNGALPFELRPSTLAEALEGVEVCRDRPRLEVPPEGRDYRQRLFTGYRVYPGGDKLVGLVPGSVWPTKRWPAARFAELAGELARRGWRIVVLGGPGEEPLAARLREGVGAEVLDTTGNTIKEAMGVISACRVVVGGDSGLVHIARALGTPTVIIFGPTDERRHALDAGTAVVALDLPCRPCGPHGQARCPEDHHRCMEELPGARVLAALTTLDS